jgi:hypothetical protein
MMTAKYRGFVIECYCAKEHEWRVEMKNHLLHGSLTSLKKSIDFFCNTGAIKMPEHFEKKESKSNKLESTYCGCTLKNLTGDPAEWFCLVNGKLVKGTKVNVERQIESVLQMGLPER